MVWLLNLPLTPRNIIPFTMDHNFSKTFSWCCDPEWIYTLVWFQPTVYHPLKWCWCAMQSKMYYYGHVFTLSKDYLWKSLNFTSRGTFKQPFVWFSRLCTGPLPDIQSIIHPRPGKGILNMDSLFNLPSHFQTMPIHSETPQWTQAPASSGPLDHLLIL